MENTASVAGSTQLKFLTKAVEVVGSSGQHKDFCGWQKFKKGWRAYQQIVPAFKPIHKKVNKNC
jgi:hypothetical protein